MLIRYLTRQAITTNSHLSNILSLSVNYVVDTGEFPRENSHMAIEMRSLIFSPERVKHIRVLLGETQEEFAERLGVNVNMVGRWERDEAEPMRGPVLKALLDAEAASL